MKRTFKFENAEGMTATMLVEGYRITVDIYKADGEHYDHYSYLRAWAEEQSNLERVYGLRRVRG